jgi:hypothetical protein
MELDVNDLSFQTLCTPREFVAFRLATMHISDPK